MEITSTPTHYTYEVPSELVTVPSHRIVNLDELTKTYLLLNLLAFLQSCAHILKH